MPLQHFCVKRHYNQFIFNNNNNNSDNFRASPTKKMQSPFSRQTATKQRTKTFRFGSCRMRHSDRKSSGGCVRCRAVSFRVSAYRAAIIIYRIPVFTPYRCVGTRTSPLSYVHRRRTRINRVHTLPAVRAESVVNNM